jgi:hypothetical protein
LFELPVEGVLAVFTGVLLGPGFELPLLVAVGALSVDAGPEAGASVDAGTGVDVGAEAGTDVRSEACVGSDPAGAEIGTRSEVAAVFDDAAGAVFATGEPEACVSAEAGARAEIDVSAWVVAGSLCEFVTGNSEAVCVGASVWLIDCVGLAGAVSILVEAAVSVGVPAVVAVGVLETSAGSAVSVIAVTS